MKELTDKQREAAKKFSKDGPVDPVLLCDSCVEAVLLEDVTRGGGCPYCGNKRVRSALVLSDKNQEKVKAWIKEGKVDPLFMELFQESEFAQSPPSMAEMINEDDHKTINKDGLI